MKLRLWLGLALLLPAVAMADPKDDARRHFSAGLEAAKDDQFEVALQHFLAAQEAWPHPVTTYNIARAYQDLGDTPNALTYYRLYRDSAPDKAADVEPVIAVLEARLAQDGRATAPVKAVPSGSVVVAGPSEEELARLAGLAAELQALAVAWSERVAEGVASVEPEPGEPGETPGETPEIPEVPGSGFLEDAYQRVVVTASRYGQEPLDSPSTVSIVTDEDIRLMGATSIPDVLRRVVGIEAMALAAGQTEVSARGFNRELSNKTLILVDGRSVYWDFIGTTMWESFPISLEEVERIEVIRGPASAVYGANAVTGIINIITRTPGEGGNVVKAEVGTPAYGRGSLLLTGRLDRTTWRFSAGYQQSGRWGQEFEPGEHSSVALFREDGSLGMRSFRANGRVDTTFLDQGFASLSAGVTDTFLEYYNIGALGDYGLTDTHTYLRGDFAWGPVHARAFWNSDNGFTGPWWTLKGDPRLLAAQIDSDTVDVEVESNGQFETGPVKHRLNGGIGYRHKRIADFLFVGQEAGVRSDLNPITEHHFNGFISEEASFSIVKVVGSLRMDIHPLLPIAQTLSPRGSAIVRVTDTTSVRATAGTAFRAPNLVESYMDFQIGAGVDGVYIQDYGSEDLRPERILTAEIGVHDESTLYHTADLAIYYSQLRDIIVLDDVTPLVEPFQDDKGAFPVGQTEWVNSPEKYVAWGIEAEGEVFPVDGLDVYGNVAYTSIVVDTPQGSERDRSTSVWKLNGGAAYRTPFRTDVSLDLSWRSPQTWLLREFDPTGQVIRNPGDVASRLLVSARVAVRPTPDERLELAVTGWNLAAYSDTFFVAEHPKGQRLGPRVFGSVSYKF